MRNARHALCWTLGYLLAAGAWFQLSDELLATAGLAQHSSSALPMLKGLLFAGLTSAVLFVILLRNGKHQQRTQLTLSNQEERLRLALQGSGDGLWDWEVATNRTFFSTRYAAMLGESPQGLGTTHQDWHERLHPDDRVHAKQKIDALLAHPHDSHYSSIYRMRHADGSYRWVHSRGSLIRSEENSQGRFIGIASDITQQRLDEDSLRIGGAILDTTQEGVLVCDANQRIIHVNPAFTRISGYSREEAIGNLPTLVKSGRHDKAFYQQLWQTLQTEGMWSGEVWNRRKNGEVYPQWHCIRSVRDNQGRISHYLAVFSDITLLKRSQRELDHLAHHDPLTGLPNRLLFRERLETALERSNIDRSGAVLLIDLDHFKHINEGLGHNVGDALLKVVAERLLQAIPAGTTLARLGGDEFALLNERCAGTTQAAELAEHLLVQLQAPFQLGKHELYISASIGISLFPNDAIDVEQALRNADSALFKAKNNGRENYAFYAQELTEYANQRVALASSLRHALENNELTVYYQPLHALNDGRHIGMEALVRWQHPQRGLVPPGEFIPIAEDNGMIAAIDLWVLRQACEQMVRWNDDGKQHLSVAVNVSSRLFSRGELDLQVAHVLAETGLSAEQLELEITESAVMDDPNAAEELLIRLRKLGVRLSIDDFGTGYSSLARLKRLPVDKLKIDQSFVRGLPHDADDAAITRAIIALGQSLGMTVLAEGIETDSQREFLRKLGCDYGQGYHFGRPQPPIAPRPPTPHYQPEPTPA